jgi:ssRNA-specific RNase YbeY (16S rRNA maturation enzyme)
MDHIIDIDQIKMEKIEIDILSKMNINDPYKIK